jgi:uncharacterized protein
MTTWKFYGRNLQLEHLEMMLARKRWFFAKVMGRRRIGKTTMIQRAMQQVKQKQPVFYVQIPDSEPAGVISTVRDALDLFGVPANFPRPNTMQQLAKLIEAMARAGYILILDEFQYFHRRGYEEFCSYLQASVDSLSATAEQVRGGLIVLGSIYTEMVALLEDRAAPLYNRVTDAIDITHLEPGAVQAILRDHADTDPKRFLFLWNLFEGVPKFYRDCYELGVLNADRKTLLKRIFFESSSPLKSEAENWFLRELHGRYDLVLKYVARKPGCMHGDLVHAIQATSGEADTQIGGYLRVLMEKYRLLERRLPIFAKPEAKRGRYYINDNFLVAWLAAIANPVAAVVFRPLDGLLSEADTRLADCEGRSLERLVGLYQERSRLGIGFPLTHRVQGYWDKADTEIDLVAVNEEDRVIRFGSCKRAAEKLLMDVNNLQKHAASFLESRPEFADWKQEYTMVAPLLSLTQRKALEHYGIIPQDLKQLLKGLK